MARLWYWVVCLTFFRFLMFRGDLLAANIVELQAALTARTLRFHEGQIRGALPQVRGA